MHGFSKPCRFDRNKNGRVMVYIRDTVPSKILVKHSCLDNIEFLFIELNIKVCKLLLCDYKKFDSLKFNNELKNVLPIENIDNCTKFDQKFLEVLDKHAPLKRKLLKANHASYVSKA